MSKNLTRKLNISITLIIALTIAYAWLGNYIVKEEGGAHIDDGTVTSSIENGEYESPYDCIIVLGAAVYEDRTPTPMLQDRLDTAIDLYKRGIAPKLLMSGDNGQVEYNEVETMRVYAVAQGVKEEDIFLDHAGFSTYETMYRAKHVFNVNSAVIVTQRYHEYRSLYIAERVGIDKVTGECAKYVNYDGSDRVGNFKRSAREVLARNKDLVKCVIMPESTFLGDVIDIKGDGRVSW